MTTTDITRTTRLKALAIISALAFAALGIIVIITQQQPTAYAQQQQQSQTFMAKLTCKDDLTTISLCSYAFSRYHHMTIF
jgi:hypothetical protein